MTRNRARQANHTSALRALSNLALSDPSGRPEIRENVFYRTEDITSMFSRHFLETLRRRGLRALCGWYRGQDILDAFNEGRKKSLGAGPEFALSPEEERKVMMTDDTTVKSMDPPAIGPLDAPRRPEAESLASQRARLKRLG